MASKLTNCPVCGAEMAASAKVCPKCGAKNKKPFYKRWWFIALVIIFVLAVAGSGGSSKKSTEQTDTDRQASTAQTNHESQQTASEAAAADSEPVPEPEPEPEPEPQITYTHYNVTELFDILSSNALKAESTFKGQYVEIEGYLGTIDSSGKYISVGAKSDNYDYFLSSVHANIKTDEQRNQIMEMSKDDPITVRGKIKSVGEVLGYSMDIDSIN